MIMIDGPLIEWEVHLIGRNGQSMHVFLQALGPLFLVQALQQIEQLNNICPRI
jgi:hypothetical protein